MEAERRIADAHDHRSHRLDLANLGLSELPSSLQEVKTLTALDLSGNELAVLPGWLGELTGLTSLDLTRNELRTLPDSLGGLSRLTTLKLSFNRLGRLPACIGALTSLCTLKLARNGLRELPEWINGLGALRCVDLTGNELQTLPDAVGELTALAELDLTGNRLRTLPDTIGKLTGLTSLVVPGNELASLPAAMDAMTGLTALDLAENLLSAVPDSLGDLSALASLDLTGNRLRVLPDSIGTLSALTTLNLARNELQAVPESLGGLAALTTLNLDGNDLRALPGSLADMGALLVLDVRGNPLTSPPPEVAAQGVDAIRAYLRANHTAIRQWTSKLMIVGEGRVGKTSLVKALAGQPHDLAEPTTHGLLITRLPVAHPSEPDTGMELTVWDFGGQDIYHATHQFFLTGRSLFVLVWNAGEGTERGRLRYWLDIITARAPQAPILIVATYTADRPADIDMDALRRRYPAIVDHFSVDCAARTGIDSIRAAVAETAAGLPLMGASWPRTWVAATAVLKRSGHPAHVSATVMRQTMHQAGVTDPAEQQTLATALHHRGEILHLAEDDDLADTVVLDPQWLNTHIARILDSPRVAQRRGLLTTSDMEAAWADLPRADREHMLTLMDRFDVSYRVRDGSDGALGIVVSWLPQSPPDITPVWGPSRRRPGTRELRLIYELPVMPPGIPGWFLARSHRFATPYRWRTGAVLRHPDGEHLGLLRTDAHRLRIDLTVVGPMPAPFFSILDDGLNLTLDRYPGLKVTRWVPCHGRGHEPCGKEFDYARIVDRLKRDHHDIYCDVAEDMVEIADLLVGITPANRDLAGTDLRKLIATGFDTLRADLETHHALAQRSDARVSTLVQKAQQAHCPSVFTIVPSGRTRPGKTMHILRLYCEEPGAWHPMPGDDGCYEISELSEWLRKAGPYLTRTLRILKAAAPYAGPILGIAAHDLQEHLKEELELLTRVIEDVPADPLAGSDPQVSGRVAPTRHADTEADFRVLRHMLLKLDPAERWGGLSHRLTPEGLSLYLCAEHWKAYQQLPAS
ncbi:COR domain-containing protein [Catellatospora methionotrophica]|uniref:COR domain-containing protein n=1 Tax=Catellatospora methionotrophica TaxID=121620 RepID=UPI0033CA1F3E